jgi:hypothetical protein
MRYASGEPFPWKQLGITNQGIWDLWVLNQADNVAPVPCSRSRRSKAPAKQPQRR